MKAVLLAGGLGTRLREETEYRPKPMVEIGGRPILWHIMKNLSSQGITDFIICLGYKGDMIRDYFLNYYYRNNDLSLDLGAGGISLGSNSIQMEPWRVTLVDTGLSTQTGGRIKRIQKYVGDEAFLCTYGDGLADVSIEALRKSHYASGSIATLTAVQPISRFGVLRLDESNQIRQFLEKPNMNEWVNGGFFVFESEIFDYLEENSMLESEPLETLASIGQLHAYKHDGFWQSMDTYRETLALNSLWEKGSAPWKNWTN